MILGLLLVAAILIIGRQEWIDRRLRQELAIRHRQGLEFASLQEENRKLVAGQISSEELERLRHRLVEAEQKKSPGGPPTSRPASAVVHAEMIPAGDWKFAGRDTPKAVFESVLWAATHQEVDQLAALLAFDPKTREGANAFFAQLPDEIRAQYSNPERIAATMLAARLPDNLSAAGVLLNVSSVSASDSARFLMRVERSDGTKRDTFFEFQRGTDGWQLLVPSEVLTAYQSQLAKPLSPGKDSPPGPQDR